MSLSRPFIPAGPVSASFISHRAMITAIMGPIGGGKTSAALMKAIYIAREQNPDPDGVRRTRFAFIRKTYRDLERTLIKSWFDWVPQSLGDWKGGTGGQPAQHILRFRPQSPDGTTVECEVLFLAIGENSAEEALRGLEVTGFFLDEADTLDEEVLIYAISRAGRYPKTDPANGFPGPTWSGVWMAFNAPDTDNWVYRRFVDEQFEGHHFFRQPGGLEAGAENLANLPESYYQRAMMGQPDWWMRRMIHNQFGYSRDGKPVYPEFSERRHLAPTILRPTKGLPILIGLDGGRTPAAVLEQISPEGQRRTIAELVTDGMGATRFGRALRDFLDRDFAGLAFKGWGDPAASWAARDDEQERSWLEIVSNEARITFLPAPSNDPTIRLEAVRRDLLESIDGDTPAYLCSPACRVLVKGFLSHYRYRRMAVAGGARFDDRPEKNDWSHVHDAKQYVTIGDGGHVHALGRAKSRFSAPIQADTGFSVFGGRR
ncbi:terminase family protein [Magnetospirillum moscoviense]|nr:terminase family protein [Magnetospirillum moscoviense]